MMSTSQKSKKEGTKGTKQIVEENEDTLKFYLYIILSVGALSAIIQAVFQNTQWVDWVLFVLSILCQLGSFAFMRYISRPFYAPNGAIQYPGNDLSIPGGIAEHGKDIILLCAGLQIGCLLSTYIWMFLLLMPIRAVYILWVNILAPWFFQEAPQETEADEKKRKKMDRRMRRQQ